MNCRQAAVGRRRGVGASDRSGCGLVGDGDVPAAPGRAGPGAAAGAGRPARATIRGDGAPRVSPVEPFVLDSVLWLSMLWQSKKAADLMRDPRILVHSVVTSRDGGEGEFKVRGTARSEHELAVQHRYPDAVARGLGWALTPRWSPCVLHVARGR